MFQSFVSYILVCMSLMSSLSYSFEDRKKLTPSELYSSSDVVAFVQVIQGKMLGNTGNSVTFEIKKLIKGSLEGQELSLDYEYIYSPEVPDRLGATYLIFFKKTEENRIHINDHGYSAIEVSKVFKDRKDIDLVYKRLGIRPDQSRPFDDEFVFYPSVCTQASKVLCKLALENIDVVL